MTLLLAGCSDDKKSEGEIQAACKGSPLATPDQLPHQFPPFNRARFTQESMRGPTEIIEGYYDGDLESGYEEVKSALEKAAGFTVLFSEIEEDDAEVSWKGYGRSGQVALRAECGDENRTFLHITNRPD